MRRLALVVVVAALAAACGGEDIPEGRLVEGIVVAVDGDLASVESFTVVDGSGESHVFVPTEGLTFDGGPLSHLTAHLTSGEPVRVVYEDGEGGQLIAVHVTDV